MLFFPLSEGGKKIAVNKLAMNKKGVKEGLYRIDIGGEIYTT